MNNEGGKPGNVLTVNGNYTGNNGLMTFNTTLGGDNSPTDKMRVKGDTQGSTRVRVDNIGGVGAQTVNGIELVEVGGNSAGNFALTTGTVEAGAYVYTLAKGKGDEAKNWYLTSKWDGVTPPDTPDPIDNPPVVDPEGPQCIARRPEAISAILPQLTRCLVIGYTIVWASHNIRIHCVPRGRQPVCGCVMSGGMNGRLPVMVS